jgi:hypothetical protein
MSALNDRSMRRTRRRSRTRIRLVALLVIVALGAGAWYLATKSSKPAGPTAMQKWVRQVEKPDAVVLTHDFHAFIYPPAHVTKAHLLALCTAGRRDVVTVAEHEAPPIKKLRASYSRILVVGAAMYFNCQFALNHHSVVALGRIHGLALKFERSSTSFDRVAKKHHVTAIG